MYDASDDIEMNSALDFVWGEFAVMQSSLSVVLLSPDAGNEAKQSHAEDVVLIRQPVGAY